MTNNNAHLMSKDQKMAAPANLNKGGPYTKGGKKKMASEDD